MALTGRRFLNGHHSSDEAEPSKLHEQNESTAVISHRVFFRFTKPQPRLGRGPLAGIDSTRLASTDFSSRCQRPQVACPGSGHP